MQNAQPTKAFTLIELLIVVAIIGILAAIAVPNFLNAQLKAKISRAKADIRNLGVALDSYQLDNNHYPGGAGNWCSGCRFWQRHSYRFHPLTTPISYISSIPTDPFQDHMHPFESHGGLLDGAYIYGDRTESGTRDMFERYEKPFEFFLGSWGPDRTWEAFKSFDRDRIYHASNGLMSGGDIMTYGPGWGLY